MATSGDANRRARGAGDGWAGGGGGWAAGAGRGGPPLPRGLLAGARLSPVQRSPVGDPAVVRAPRRPDPRADPAAVAGAARAHAGRAAGAPGLGGSERDPGWLVCRAAAPGDGTADDGAAAGGV